MSDNVKTNVTGATTQITQAAQSYTDVIGSVGIQSLQYPSYLGEERYKNRKVIFKILRNQAQEQPDQKIDVAKKNKIVNKKITESISMNDLGQSIKQGSESLLATHDLNSLLQATIVLPMPNKVTDSQSHSWELKNGFISQVATTGMDALQKTLNGSLDRSNSKLASLIGSVVDIDFDTHIGQISRFAGIRKPIVNPDYFQNYKGSEPRSVTFSYSMIPDNPREAENIRKIILLFKSCSSPSLALNGYALLSPYHYAIEFDNKAIDSMFALRQMVLKDISVDYGGSSDMQLLHDGMPKQIDLTLSFCEAELTYAEAYAKELINLSETNDVSDQQIGNIFTINYINTKGQV